jgi:hypothetical protein
MRLFGIGIVVLIILSLAGWAITQAAWMGWLVIVAVAVGIIVPVGSFLQRANAPDDKFPWE